MCRMCNCLIVGGSGKQTSWNTERFMFVNWPDSKRLHQHTAAVADRYHFRRLLVAYTVALKVFEYETVSV